jgi:hypothetical protein
MSELDVHIRISKDPNVLYEALLARDCGNIVVLPESPDLPRGPYTMSEIFEITVDQIPMPYSPEWHLVREALKAGFPIKGWSL